MIPDTKSEQTNYCPNCEDQARRIAELERHNRVLIDAAEGMMRWQVKNVSVWHNGAYDYMHEAINATPDQTEAWEWNQHVEWMRKQGSMTHVIVRNDDVRRGAVDSICKLKTPLYAIPELKEVTTPQSPESDTDQATRLTTL